MPYSPKDQKWIQSQLRGEHIGQKIIICNSVGSTNDVAKRLADEPDQEGTVILADSQSQGKGYCTYQRSADPYGVRRSGLIRKTNKV